MQIIGMVLLVLLLVGAQHLIYSRFWDRNLALRLSFSAREAFEGETLTLVEELTNRKLLPLPWVVAGFQLSRNLRFLEEENTQISDDYYRSDMFSINMYQRITRRLEFVCARRGHYRVKSMSVGSSNIFLSAHLVRRLECLAELTVFPRLIPGPELEVLLRQILGEVEVRRFINPDPFSFRGVREYLPGDPFSSLNFKAAAQTGQLMVNVRGATASQELVILVNLEPYSDWGVDDVYEEAIRLGASLAERFLREGLGVELYCNGRDVATGGELHVGAGSGERHLYSILEGLARIELADTPAPMEGLLWSLRRPEPHYLLISPLPQRGAAPGAGGNAGRGAFGAVGAARLPGRPPALRY